ncbi:NADH-quinone oxidoreductase subunit K [bacterium]|nr:NADH-quinone oxidoreductase subunit K [bacterium]
MVYYIGAFGLIIIGLYVLMVKRNLIKMIIGISLINTGLNLFLISVGFIKLGTAPIFSKPGLNPKIMVDPLPQAMVLTAIVISVATLAMALALAIRLYEHHGTLDMGKIKDQKW